MLAEVNWTGNYAYTASRIHSPATVPDLQRIVAGANRIRGLGTRHTFNDVADSAELVTLGAMDPAIEIDPDTMTASASAGVRYGILAQTLHEAGYALHNMGSLPHISIGGATATATHGSGMANGNLATAVSGVEFVTSGGDLVQVRRGDPDFDACVVHLGALGIVSRLTFDIRPTFQVCQEVLEELPWSALDDHFDEVFGSAYSVSVFTRYEEANAGALWRKHLVTDGWTAPAPGAWSARRSIANRHPVDNLPAESCTPQLLEPGPWCFRLPHFRLDQVPASGEEIQTEYMIDISQAPRAIAALREFEPVMRESLMIGEIRTIAADDLWLSTAYGRDTVAFHFSWYMDQGKVDRLLPQLEEALAPFEPRPHWGKAFAMDGAVLSARYPRFDDFRKLRERYDPQQKFMNQYLERCGLG